jgi:hypothetical protein
LTLHVMSDACRAISRIIPFCSSSTSEVAMVAGSCPKNASEVSM